MHHQCMFDGDESNEVRDWFVQELVHPIHWNCPHPDDLPGHAVRRNDQKWPPESRAACVWDIQRSQNSAGYLTIRDRSGRKIRRLYSYGPVCG